MEYRNVPTDSLIPYERNPRRNDQAVDAVAASIREFGFKVPIVVDRDNVVVAGHTRLKAAKKLGLETVPVIVADDLTPDQIKAFRLADNKTAELAEWDLDLLDLELGEIEMDMEPFGFELLKTQEEQLLEVKEDDYEPEPPTEPKAKRGDIYQLGQHRLMCGDSTDPAVIDRLMDGVKADLVFTDPPYGMKKESEGVLNDNLNFDDLLDFNRQWIPLTFGALKDNGSWYCWGIDEPLMDIYSNILKPMAKENKITFRNLITWDKGNGQGQLSEDFRMYPVADEKCLFYVCGSTDFVSGRANNSWTQPIVEILREKAQKKGYSEKDLRKIAGLSEKSPDHFLDTRVFNFPKKEYYDAWFNDGEYYQLQNLYNELKEKHLEDRSYFNNTHDNMNDVWHFDRAGKDEREHTGGHATPKPIALCGRAIKSSSREGEIVLDVFGGSGSTLMACEQLNRKCYMCELDPRYIDVIIDRWEQFTGEKAVRVSG